MTPAWNVWFCDHGIFDIPSDVPVHLLRKDGWFDRRRKASVQLRSYFDDMNGRLRDGLPVLSFSQWRGR